MAVKEAVLPFDRFPDVDTVLGPEMRSTGEVMGVDRSFGLAFAKSQAAAGNRAAAVGHGVPLARRPRQAGRAWWSPAGSPSSASRIVATAGTAAALEAEGLPVEAVVGQGRRRREAAGWMPSS